MTRALRLLGRVLCLPLLASPSLGDAPAPASIELSVLEVHPRTGLARVAFPHERMAAESRNRDPVATWDTRPSARPHAIAVYAGFRPLGWARWRPSGLARLPLPEDADGERWGDISEPARYVTVADPRLLPATDISPGRSKGEPARDGGLVPADGPLRAWLFPPDLIGLLRPAWPLRGPLYARIEALTPGLQGAWLSAGRRAGVQPGDCWWLRIAGQPVARFDVCLVADELCYAAIVPLVAHPQLNRGDRVAAWPAPGQHRHSGARSAVSHVEGQGTGLRIWIAAPPQTLVPPEPHVEFYRGGRLIALGLVDRLDERFWHARLIVDPAGFRTAGLAGEAVGENLPRIGDDVLIRTLRDSEQRRFAARVFEVVRGGFLINAGDSDGLEYGQAGVAWRNGKPLGAVTVRRVQRVYAQVEPDERAQLAGFGVGDEVRFGAPPPGALPIGVVTEVADETLFAARLVQGGAAPLNVPLALRLEGVTNGVGLLLAAQDGWAIGIALSESLTRPLTPGQELLFELAEAGASQP